MGVECCKIRTDIDAKANKIICLKAKLNHCYIHIFNCESEVSNEIEINPRLVQVEGMAQISIENTIYLIGSNSERDNKDQGQSRAKCIDINTLALPISINYALPAKYHHYYPSLCLNNKEGIYVIGGKGSTQCEMYSIDKKCWIELPELPSERYGCSVTCYGPKQILMGFGGLNSVTGQISNEIMQLATNKNAWDKVGELTQESSIRYWSAIVNYKQSIILIGGVGQNNKPTDDISSVDMSNSDITSHTIAHLKLSTMSRFQFIFSYGESNGTFYLFDEDDFQIHKVLLNPKKSQLISFYHANNTY